MFQSTPGRSAGRIWMFAPEGNPALDVSIHARPLGRANRDPSALNSAIVRFQSTPGRSAGRIRVARGEIDRLIVFQSTPGRSAGRIPRCPQESGRKL
uniref:Uncharacterized protein n=1 Tax=mine drainage metagenome TaxID=410659 RepID=E6PG36_9ZZZZ